MRLCRHKRPYALLLLLLSWSNYTIAQDQDPMRLPLQKGHRLAILEVRWSPNDKLLLTYSAADALMNIWQMPETRLLTTIEDSTVRTKGTDKRALRAFCRSSDSRLIATGNENGSAQVWEAQTGKLLWTTRIAPEYVTGVGFSGDSKYLAAVASPKNKDHRIVLLDVATGRIIKKLGTTKGRFQTHYHDAKLVFSDDNKQLVVGDTGGVITRWDLNGGSLLSAKTLDFCRAEEQAPNRVVYTEDLTLVGVRCGYKTYVMDTVSGSILRQTSTSTDFSSSIVLSRDKQFMAIHESGSTKLLNLADGTEVVFDNYLPITCGCDFNKDSSLLAMDDFFAGETVKIIDLKSKQMIARVEAHPGEIESLAFSPDGKLLASGSKDRIVRLWDAHTGALLHALAGHNETIDVVAFTPDGKLLFSAAEKSLKVWEVATGKLVRNVAEVAKVSSITFNPDGKLMVTTDRETVGLWDLSNWTMFRAFRTEESHTYGNVSYCCGSTAQAARFDAQGQMIISGHEDGTIKVWNPKPTQPLPNPYSELVRVLKTNASNQSFALSPDDTLLVVDASGEVPPAIWDWLSGKPIRSLSRDANYVQKMVFSPDSRIIATSDVGGQIALWNVGDGKLVREFDGGFSGYDALAFSPDGTRLVSGGQNQNIIMWDVKTGARLWSVLPVTRTTDK